MVHLGSSNSDVKDKTHSVALGATCLYSETQDLLQKKLGTWKVRY